MLKLEIKMNKLASIDLDLMLTTRILKSKSLQIDLAPFKFNIQDLRFQKTDVAVFVWAKKNLAIQLFHHAAASEV